MSNDGRSPMFKKKVKGKKIFWDRVRVVGFCAILFVFFVIGLLFFLRPDKSVLEKRKLAKFPEAKGEKLINGEFFTELSTWYADTYPMRESMISFDSKLKNMYGLHADELHGEVAANVDEIPDTDDSGKAPTVAPIITTEAPSSNKDKKASSSDAAKSETTTEEGYNVKDPEHGKDGTLREKGEEAGTVYISGGKAFNVYYFGQDNADYYASVINTIATKIPKGCKFTEMLVPTAFGVYLGENIQKDLGGSDQEKAIDYMYSMMSDDINKVRVMDILKDHNAEYLYFNTDHHWTPLGAYYAYYRWCQSREIVPHTLDQFEKVEYDNFLGTFYAASGQSETLRQNADTIIAYIPMGTNDCTFIENGVEIPWKVVYDVSDYPDGGKYSCFIGADNELCTIVNPKIHDGSACLLIKESYGNAFAPFLVDHFEKTFVVDYRYSNKDLVEFIKQEGIDEVIILNNMEAIHSEHSNMMLNLFP